MIHIRFQGQFMWVSKMIYSRWHIYLVISDKLTLSSVVTIKSSENHFMIESFSKSHPHVYLELPDCHKLLIDAYNNFFIQLLRIKSNLDNIYALPNTIITCKPFQKRPVTVDLTLFKYSTTALEETTCIQVGKLY